MAAETFELYSLTSKLSLDATQFDRVYGDSRKKMATLSEDFKRVEKSAGGLGTKFTQTLRPSFAGLESSITGLGGPLDGTIRRFGSLTDIGGKLSLTTAGLGLGFGVVATAGIAVAAGMFSMAKSAAAAGDEIFDLTQKVNFSAESISTLKNEGELAGVEFQTIGAALGIFNKNVEAAQSGNKALANTFKVLKIDLGDNETALRSAFKALMAVEDEGQQAALAMQIFGKSGKEVLGIIHSMNGDIDAATEKFRGMNSLITTESAKAANEFSDKLKLLEQRFDGVTRSIGERFMPTATSALDKVSQALDDNSQHAKTWADALVASAEFAATQIKYILEGLAIVIEGFQKTFGEGSIVGDAIKGETQRKLLQLPDGRTMDLNTRETFDLNKDADKRRFFGQPSAGYGGDPDAEYAVPYGRVDEKKKKTERINFGGGGGGKGGGSDPAKVAGQIAKLKLDATMAGLKAEEDANRRSLELRRKDFNEYATQYIVIENRRHAAVVAGLDGEQRAAERLKKGKAVALLEIENKRTAENTQHEQNRNRVLDERGKILDQIDTFLRDQDREIVKLTTSTSQWDDVYQQLVDTLKEEGVTLEDNTRARIEANIARAKELDLILSVTRARRVADSVRDRFVTKEGRERPPWIDLGGGSTVGGEPATTERRRVATVDEQVARERREMLRDKMAQVAGDLTQMIDEAITAGFEGGLDDGVKAFGLAILRMAKHEALEVLRKAIFKALNPGGESDEQSGGGGSSWLSTLIKTGVGVIAGLFGGGSSGGLGSAAAGAIGGAASGGYQSPNSWYWRGERGPELVKAGPMGDSVMSNSDSMMALAGAGGQTINIYAQDVRAAFSRQTVTQAKSKLAKLQRGR